MACPNQGPCGGCSELARLDVTKPTPQNFLDLIHKRHFIKSNVNLWHDRLASRFPQEIMSLIFIFFDNVNKPGEQEVIDMSKDEHDNWDHLLRTPNLLSKVCRRWRGIALSTPQLWTKYFFNVWTQARPSHLELLKEFLSRSGSLPLSIIMWGDLANDDDEDLKSISMKPIANLIRSYSARWKFLDIYNVPEGLTEELFKDLNYIPPSVLEGLRIDYFYLAQPIPLSQPLRPRHLSIQYMQYRGKTPIIPLEWYNITHLEISKIGMNTLLDIVKQIPRLTKWLSSAIASEFEDPGYPTDPFPETPIVIPTLEHLELTFKDNNPHFFSYLTLPNLTHLQCHFGDEILGENEDLEFDDLISFLTRSKLDSESLQSFKLEYNIGGGDYDHRFMDLKALTHLSIHVIDRENVVTDPYLSGMSNISILPHLRQVHIEVPNMPSSSWAHLCDLFRGGHMPVDQGLFGPSDSPLVTPQAEEPALLSRFHKRPLEYVSVMVFRRRDIQRPIIPYSDCLFLQEIREDGLVTLEFTDFSHGPMGYQYEDILDTMARQYKFYVTIEEYLNKQYIP